MFIDLSSTYDHKEDLIFKQRAKISEGYPAVLATFPSRQLVQKWISARLLEFAGREDTRTFLVQSVVDDNAAVKKTCDFRENKRPSCKRTPTQVLVSRADFAMLSLCF